VLKTEFHSLSYLKSCQCCNREYDQKKVWRTMHFKLRSQRWYWSSS